MKLGGLFSGVGGFELAWTQLGHEVAWMCEWDKNARKVLEERFPGVPIYPDVRDLDPAEVEAVDVLTGGSPCQGFSIAGTRSGLEHSESQLFADYVRVMDGLAERGLRYAIWENVPGVLSIRNDDGERTFAHVVGALAGGSAAVRLDASRKWNAGLVANGRRAVSWRVLDSRYFGVAQRRRRVFACVAFGDSAADRAGRTLLAVAEGVRGDSASSQSEGEGAAGGVAGGVGGPSVAGRIAAEYAVTLKARMGKDTNTEEAAGGHLIIEPSYGMYGNSGQEGATVEEQPSITASHGQPGNVAQAFNWMSGGDCRGLDLTAETSGLTTQQTPAVLLTMRAGKPGGGKGPLLAEEQSLTLATGNGQTLFQPQAFDEMNFTTNGETHHVLRAGTKQSTGAITDTACAVSPRSSANGSSRSLTDGPNLPDRTAPVIRRWVTQSR
jgi:DNA (cytosine-5)-methyltransferase 1